MQHIDNTAKNCCIYKYHAKNQMKIAKTIDFLLSPIHSFCTAIWCQSAHRTRSNSSGNPTHSKDDLQPQQRRKLKALSKAQRL